MSVPRNNALALLLNYDSDSDKDSGYMSDDGKKRKLTCLNVRERQTKKRRPQLEEMIIDPAPVCSELISQRQDETNSQNFKSREDFVQRNDLLPSTSHCDLNKTKRLIPLPEEFMVSENDNIDDSSEHQGRVRSFAHERGNWASLLYIPLCVGTFSPHLKSLVSVLCATCLEKDVSLFPCDDFHISLTKTFILRLDWIAPILEDLRKVICHRFKQFSLWVHSLSVFCNEEGSRTFLSLRVGFGKDQLQEIADVADAVLNKYRISALYEDNCFHVSVAWCHGDRREILHPMLPLLQNVCNKYFDVETHMRTYEVDKIILKTGSRLNTIYLKS